MRVSQILPRNLPIAAMRVPVNLHGEFWLALRLLKGGLRVRVQGLRFTLTVYTLGFVILAL